MSMKSLITSILFALLAVVSAVVPASAGTFAIDPTRLSFTTMASGDVTVTNVGQTPMRLSVHAYDWTQNGGRAEVLTPTTDVAYYPQVFSLPPGASQRIRVGIVRQPAAVEQTFRLVVNELPPQAAFRAAGVSFLSRVDIPVLLGAAGASAADPRLGELETHTNAVTLHLENRGTAHVEQSQVTVTALDADKRVLWRSTTNAFYVLAHSSLGVRCAIPGNDLHKARTLTAVWQLRGGPPIARTYSLR